MTSIHRHKQSEKRKPLWRGSGGTFTKGQTGSRAWQTALCAGDTSAETVPTGRPKLLTGQRSTRSSLMQRPNRKISKIQEII